MNNKHQWVLVVSIAAALIFVFSQFMSHSEPDEKADLLADQDFTEILAEDVTDLAEEQPLEEGDFPTEPEVSAKTSFWVKEDKKSSPAQTARLNEPVVLGTEWGDEYQVREAVESALNGSVEDTVEIGDIFSRCVLGFDSEAQFKSGLSRTSKNVSNGGPVPSVYLAGTGERLKFENYDDYEEYMWIRFSECTASKSVFDQSVRDRLVEMAEAGNVAARFLYAMRLPDRGGIRAETMVDWLIYQKLAEEFTWQNINEGEPLGLLAYGRSLEGGHSYYFTPRNTIYGNAFIWAAQKCGLNSTMVNEKISNLTTGRNRGIAQVGGSMEKLANELVETFCD